MDVFRGRVALADASAALEHLNTAVSATPAGRGLGVDGITVGIESRLPELECSFTVWSPRKPGERGFELTSALLALAATIQDDAAQHVLATLR